MELRGPVSHDSISSTGFGITIVSSCSASLRWHNSVFSTPPCYHSGPVSQNEMMTILRYQTISVRASKNSNPVCPFLYLTETEHSLHFKLERT